MNTNSIKRFFRTITAAKAPWYIVLVACSTLLFTQIAHTEKYPEEILQQYSHENIYSHKPCSSGNNSNNFSSICGDTPREKYWSVLRQTFDEIHTAAIFGSIDHEGSFGPTLWQYNIVPAGSGAFKEGITWERLYGCSGNCPGGVGAFQITGSLGPYLQYVDGQDSSLTQYFKDPSYSLPGDAALERIGVTDFDKLVQQEVEFVLNHVDKEGFQATTTIEEATDWWTMKYENCADCCGSADNDHSCEQIAPRRESAQKEFDEMKNFTCSGSSSSGSATTRPHSTSANTSQFTLLEGYGNLTFYGPDAASNGGYAGRNGTESINGGALADGQVARDTRDGGALAFGDIIYIETTSEEGAESSYANGRYFIVADTGGETAHSEKWDIDVFVDEPNPSALNYPPYGSTTNAKIYKVASGVSWDEYLATYANGGPNCDDITGEDITWIGDSYSTGAQPIIEREFPGITFGGSVNDDNSYIQDCKHVDLDTTCQANPSLNPSGLNVLRRITSAGDLKPYLVMALGTNNGWDNNMTNKFQEIMSSYPDTKVIFVTSRTTLSDFSASNEILKSFVNSNNNYYLADWAAAYDASYFGNDAEHPTTNGGYEKWVGLISDAINSSKTCNNSNTNACGSGGSNNNSIADTALLLSWDCVIGKGCHSEGSPPYEPKPEYVTAMQQVGTYDNPGGWGYGASCDRFVATVMRYSKADENFPTGYANDSGNYMISHPELYQEINFNGSNFDVLQPGDIFSTFGPSTSGGHIWIYVEINGEPGRADASNGNSSGRTAEHYTRTPVINDGRQFKVFRRK